MLPRPGVTQNLARFVVETRWEDIPEQARHEAKRALLNFFAVAIAGCRTEPVELALKTLAEFSGGKQATIVGRTERIDALSAAFLNAAGANVFDYCDTHLPTVVHPTAPLAPALLALAELRRVTGPRAVAGLRPRLRDRMPGGRRGVARPLPQGLAHHLDLRRLRLGGGRGEAAGIEGEPGGVEPGQRLDPVGGPVRMPGLAGQERQRRQRRAQRPVLGAAGGKGFCRTGRADRRRAGLSGRHGRAAELGGADRRPGRDLGSEQQFPEALSGGLRDPPPARLRARLAAPASRASGRKGHGARQSPAAAANRSSRGRDRPRIAGQPAARGCRGAGAGQGRARSVHRRLRQRPRRPGDARQVRGGGRSGDLDHRRRDGFLDQGRQEAQRLDPGRPRQLGEPAEGRGDRTEAPGRGEELAARSRHPAADRCGVGAGQEWRCLEPGRR